MPAGRAEITRLASECKCKGSPSLRKNYANTIPNLSIGDDFSASALGSGQFTNGISDSDLGTANALLSSLAGIISGGIPVLQCYQSDVGLRSAGGVHAKLSLQRLVPLCRRFLEGTQESYRDVRASLGILQSIQ